MNYHTLSPEKSIEKLSSNIQTGLSTAEASLRYKKYGPNELPSEKPFTVLNIFLQQIIDPMILILVFAALITYFIGHLPDFYIILAVIFFELIIGFVEEYRSEKIVEQLLKYSKTLARVIRDGEEIKIQSSELVPGDIVILSHGQKIPADARVLSTEYLKVDESILTGESDGVEKNTQVLPEDTPINQLHNTLFQGTFVLSGTALAIVTQTGFKTEFGKISERLKSIKKQKTPLQKKLMGFTLVISALVVIFLIISILVGLWLGKPLVDILLLAISISVSAIPEGFPIIVSIALVVGVARLARKKVIIRHLPSVETLGSTSVICMDKTGTLTENRHSVKKIILPNDQEFEIDQTDYSPQGNFLLEGQKIKISDYPDLDLLLTGGVLCNDSSIKKVDEEWISVGDPTESALIAAAAKANIDPDSLIHSFSREYVIPFKSGQNFMLTVNHSAEKNKRYIFIKGSPEKVLPFCSYKSSDNKTLKLTPKEKSDILLNVDNLASKSFRVLALAYKDLSATGEYKYDDTSLKYGVVFQGLIAIFDPIRSSAQESLREAKLAGLKVIIITGDHPNTAVNVAKSLGLKIEDKNIITGEKLASLTDIEFNQIADDILIYARVLPEQKLKIVEYHQQKGEVVAMTGDGINDAPALKKSDIGISMGNGADIAKESSEIILLENNFSNIIETIKQGRIIYDNIKKSVLYLLGHNIGEVGVILVCLLTGLPLPLLPTQILWMNLVTDGLIDESLVFEPAEPGVMSRGPRRSDERFLNNALIRRIIIIGVFISLVSYFVFRYYYQISSIDYARTIVFTLMAFFAFFGVLANRTLYTPLIKTNFLGNNLFFYTAFFSICLQLIVVYIPRFNGLFHTIPLKITDLIILVFIAVTLLIVVESEKYLTQRFTKKTIA